MTESDIEKAFVQFADSVGCQALKLRLDGQNGWPDRTLVTPRGIFFAEFKSAKGRLRPMQKVWISALESMGYVVITPKRPGEAEDFLRRWLDEDV